MSKKIDELKAKSLNEMSETASEFKKNNGENEKVIKKPLEETEAYTAVRVSPEVHRIIKINALMDDITMKEYLDRVVLEDNEKRKR